MLIEQLGGAVSRVGKDATAFNHRDSPYDLVIMPMWSDPEESAKHMRKTLTLQPSSKSWSPAFAAAIVRVFSFLLGERGDGAG